MTPAPSARWSRGRRSRTHSSRARALSNSSTVASAPISRGAGSAMRPGKSTRAARGVATRRSPAAHSAMRQSAPARACARAASRCSRVTMSGSSGGRCSCSSRIRRAWTAAMTPHVPPRCWRRPKGRAGTSQKPKPWRTHEAIHSAPGRPWKSWLRASAAAWPSERGRTPAPTAPEGIGGADRPRLEDPKSPSPTSTSSMSSSTSRVPSSEPFAARLPGPPRSGRDQPARSAPPACDAADR
mmetsp:Transcript_17157/g.49774  ORF Transcript_17157/g.49774 Transcript_17157/m.49774 type:complete len:241 (-) Transcript_17157:473-1195(-)